MKKIYLLLVSVSFSTLILSSCGRGGDTTDSKQAEETEKIQDRLNSQYGLPNVPKGTEKGLVKELYELRDQANLVTYTYTFSEMTGEFRFLGKSIGFGIPASVQYSNPEKRVNGDSRHEYRRYNIPQAEPNGLFMPEGLSATWVFLINEVTHEPSPTYVEPTITVTLFPLRNAVYPQNGDSYESLIKAIKR